MPVRIGSGSDAQPKNIATPAAHSSERNMRLKEQFAAIHASLLKIPVARKNRRSPQRGAGLPTCGFAGLSSPANERAVENRSNPQTKTSAPRFGMANFNPHQSPFAS